MFLKFASLLNMLYFCTTFQNVFDDFELLYEL